MSFDIIIGRKHESLKWGLQEHTDQEYEEDNYLSHSAAVIPCEGKEPRGLTSAEWTIHQGQPQRSPANASWYEFQDRAELAGFKQHCGVTSNDPRIYPLNSPDVLHSMDLLEKSLPILTDGTLDRAKWLIFWVREAIHKYGNDAAIWFS